MKTLRLELLRMGPVVAALAVHSLCAAHTGIGASTHHDAMSAMWNGFVHPFTGADHWAAMIALGLWSAMTVKRVVIAPLVFSVMLVAGAMLGFMHAPIAVIEPMIACSILVLGLLIAMRWKMPSWAAALIAGVFAIFHGAAHGFELAGPAQAFALIGMLAATLLLVGLGIMLGGWLPRHVPWAQRLGGAALALFGAVLLGPFA